MCIYIPYDVFYWYYGEQDIPDIIDLRLDLYFYIFNTNEITYNRPFFKFYCQDLLR